MAEHELLITRLIAYPIDVVFDAWTDPGQLVQWFAPRDCQIVVCKLDLREGGKFHWCVKNPNYPDCWCTGEFLRIRSPFLIQYKIRFSDPQGNPVSAQKAFKQPDWPEETLVTVGFTEQGDDTEITIRQSVVEAVARTSGAYQGWIEMMDKLQLLLSPASVDPNQSIL